MPTEVIGKPIDRVDGRLKVTGAARYASDAPVAATAYALMVQSTIPKGRITNIDASAAEKSPGVLAVLSHLNAPPLKPIKPNFMTGGVPAESRMPLSDDVVHYAGQTVAVVVADTLERVRTAARLVKVQYNAEPAGISFDDAKKYVEPEQNFGEEMQYSRGDTEKAIAAARQNGVVVEATYHTPVETHSPMEPSATVAVWEGDRLTVYDATQWIVGVQAVMAEAFGIPKANVHVVCPFVGGAFGCKAFIWPYQLLCVMAARVVQRPVKLALPRSQMFTSCGHRPSTRQKLIIAAGRDGKLSAIRHDTLTETSAVSDYVEPCGLASSRMMYAVPNVTTPHRVAVTNVASATFMRAPGETPGMYALESAMDELAYELKLDPLELRRLNYADKFPPTGQPFSSNHLLECYKLGAEKIGWDRRAPAPRATKDGRWLVGYGMASARFPGLRWVASAFVQLDAGGKITAGSATHDLGTGAYTVFTQVTAQEMGIDASQVNFKLGDSTLPPAPVAGGSNSTATVSQAIIAAAGVLKGKLATLAVGDAKSPLNGLNPEQISVAGGKIFLTADPSRGESCDELLRRSGQSSIRGDAMSAPGAEQAQYAFHSLGAQLCEVRVDESLGIVRVSRFVSVMDVGRVLNPKTARSQVLGGVTMGIGMALMEHTVYDARTARPVTDNFADYAIPVNADIQAIDVIFVDKPDPYINSLGCRGVGEVGITGVAAAVANAVYHATGRRVRDLPITPDKLLGTA